MYRRITLALFSLVLLFLGVSPGSAQHRSGEYVGAETNLVRIQVLVFDDKGAIASDLTRQDFRVFDDGVEQKIQYFSHARQPVSLVLSLDESQSMKKKIPFVREAAYSLMVPFPDAEGQKRFRDEFSLIRFALRAEVVAPFSGGEDLQPRIDSLIQPTESSTPLFDSVYLAAATEQDALNERRAIILVTDGGDNHSLHTLSQTKHFLEETGVPLFAVMAGPSLSFPFFSPSDKKPDSKAPLSSIMTSLGTHIETGRPRDFIGPAERRGPHNLKVLAETTGGSVFTANHLEDLQRIVQTIGIAVRYSYLIGYDPPLQANETHPQGWDGWHKVSVQLSPAEKYRGFVTYAKRRYRESETSDRQP
jgi:Ca-activated chloride channel homolog